MQFETFQDDFIIPFLMDQMTVLMSCLDDQTLKHNLFFPHDRTASFTADQFSLLKTLTKKSLMINLDSC